MWSFLLVAFRTRVLVTRGMLASYSGHEQSFISGCGLGTRLEVCVYYAVSLLYPSIRYPLGQELKQLTGSWKEFDQNNYLRGCKWYMYKLNVHVLCCHYLVTYGSQSTHRGTSGNYGSRVFLFWFCVSCCTGPQMGHACWHAVRTTRWGSTTSQLSSTLEW